MGVDMRLVGFTDVCDHFNSTPCIRRNFSTSRGTSHSRVTERRASGSGSPVGNSSCVSFRFPEPCLVGRCGSRSSRTSPVFDLRGLVIAHLLSSTLSLLYLFVLTPPLTSSPATARHKTKNVHGSETALARTLDPARQMDHH